MNPIKMQFYQKKWFDFHIICKFVICLFLVCPVHQFPLLKESNPNSTNVPNENERTETATVPAVLETLNSIKINVNEKNGSEKPVFDRNFTMLHRSKRDIESEKSATDRTADSKEFQKSSRQFTIPFMAVPANWIATFDPTNAVILANNVPLRIWAIGNVAKFPTFLENVVQRIQSYYSTYKYHDLSRPATHAIINPQYHLQEHDNIQTLDNSEDNDSFDGIDVTESDPIEDGFETETASTLDYYDATTDINYSYNYSDSSDDDTTYTADNQSETTETNDDIEVFK